MMQYSWVFSSCFGWGGAWILRGIAFNALVFVLLDRIDEDVVRTAIL
jgi:hypothetical protein